VWRPLRILVHDIARHVRDGARVVAHVELLPRRRQQRLAGPPPEQIKLANRRRECEQNTGACAGARRNASLQAACECGATTRQCGDTIAAAATTATTATTAATAAAAAATSSSADGSDPSQAAALLSYERAVKRTHERRITVVV
jgi:hypothetical protein